MAIASLKTDHARSLHHLFEDAVDRFEQALSAGSRPAIAEYCPTDMAGREALLLELALIEMEFRLKASSLSVLDEYLERYPELRRNDDAVLKLLAAERRWLAPAAALSSSDSQIRSKRPESETPRPLLCADANAVPPQVDQSEISSIADDLGTHSEAAGKAGSARDDTPDPSRAARPAVPVTLQGRFRVLEALGAGAFGTVYRGIDLQLARMVAIKVPRIGAFGTGEKRDRLLREARSVAQLNHPNIVPVYEVSSAGDDPFIVSALVTGQTLAAALEKREFACSEAAQIAASLADALQYAHERQIVHRDIKPANIMLDQRGVPVLMDFGLAKCELDVSQTLEGHIIGTPAYMSPEQAMGQGALADGRSDIYCLGVVLYELVTGQRPFLGDVRSLTQQIINEEPRPPRALNLRIPRDLATICLKCLQKLPDARYQTAGLLGDDLRRFLNGEPVLARPVSLAERTWRRVRRRPWTSSLVAAAASLSLLLVGVLWIGSYQLDRSDQTARRATQESRHRLERLYVGNGIAAAGKGNPATALPWFDKAWSVGGKDPHRDLVNRVRLTTTIASMPTLAGFWGFEGTVNHACLSSNGRLVAFAGSDSLVSVCDVHDPSAAPRMFKHGGSVKQCTFDASGTRLATVCFDCKVRLWPVQADAPQPIELRHPDLPTCATFSPDARLLATGCLDGVIRIWNTETGAKVLPLMHHSVAIDHMMFNSDGTLLAAASRDGFVRLWSMASQTQVGEPLEHGFRVQRVCFSDDGRYLVTGCDDRFARIWDVSTQKCKVELPHDSEVIQVLYSHSGEAVIAGCSSGALLVWDAKTGARIHALEGHKNLISDVSLSADDRLLATASDDETVSLWDLTNGKRAYSPIPHPQGASGAALSSDGRVLITGGLDCTARMWNLDQQHKFEVCGATGQEVRSVEFSPRQKRILLVGKDGRPTIYEVAPGARAVDPIAEQRPAVITAIAPHGPWLAAAFDDGSVRVSDLTSPEPNHTWRPHPTSVTAMRFAPNADVLLTAGADGAVWLWNLRSDAPPLRLPPTGPLEIVDFNPTGEVVFTVGKDRNVKTWDAVSGALLSRTIVDVGSAKGWIFAPDGRHFAVSTQTQVELRDVFTGQKVLEDFKHRGNVLDAIFSPDGTRLATACSDNSARVWNTATGTHVTGSFRHGRNVTACAFSAEGDLVVSASVDRTARIWDARTGDPVSPYLEHPEPVVFVAFQSDDSELVTVTDRGRIRVWDLGDASATRARLGQLARLYSGYEINGAGLPEEVLHGQLEEDWSQIRRAPARRADQD